jgi:hypothetical protein
VLHTRSDTSRVGKVVDNALFGSPSGRFARGEHGFGSYGKLSYRYLGIVDSDDGDGDEKLRIVALIVDVTAMRLRLLRELYPN